MSSADTFKLIISGKGYKNEIRVDISDLEDVEIISLAAEVSKAMLDDAAKIPVGTNDES